MPKWLAACDDVKLKPPEHRFKSNRTFGEKSGSIQGRSRSKYSFNSLLLTKSVMETVQMKNTTHHQPRVLKLIVAKSMRKI